MVGRPEVSGVSRAAFLGSSNVEYDSTTMLREVRSRIADLTPRLSEISSNIKRLTAQAGFLKGTIDRKRGNGSGFACSVLGTRLEHASRRLQTCQQMQAILTEEYVSLKKVEKRPGAPLPLQAVSWPGSLEASWRVASESEPHTPVGQSRRKAPVLAPTPGLALVS